MDPVACQVLARCEPLSPDIACGDCSSRLQAAFIISLTAALRPGMPGRRERPSLPAFRRWMRMADKVKLEMQLAEAVASLAVRCGGYLEKIDGRAAVESPLAEVLCSVGYRVSGQALILRNRPEHA